MDKPAKTYKVCGAKRRNGEPCQKAPVEGRTRCRLHGGLTPLTNPAARTAAITHGIYTKHLTPDELLAYKAYDITSLDGELRIAKLTLERALAAQAKAATLADQLEVQSASITETSGLLGLSVTKTKSLFRHDYNADINRAQGRIESLMRTQALLKDAAGGDNAESVREFEVVPYEDDPKHES